MTFPERSEHSKIDFGAIAFFHGFELWPGDIGSHLVTCSDLLPRPLAEIKELGTELTASDAHGNFNLLQSLLFMVILEAPVF